MNIVTGYGGRPHITLMMPVVLIRGFFLPRTES